MNRKRVVFGRKPEPSKLIYVLTTEGWQLLHFHGYKEPTKAGVYWNAVKRYINTGDNRDLRKLTGQRIQAEEGTFTLETDLDTIDEYASAGELEFDDIYEQLF